MSFKDDIRQTLDPQRRAEEKARRMDERIKRIAQENHRSLKFEIEMDALKGRAPGGVIEGLFRLREEHSPFSIGYSPEYLDEMTNKYDKKEDDRSFLMINEEEKYSGSISRNFVSFGSKCYISKSVRNIFGLAAVWEEFRKLAAADEIRISKPALYVTENYKDFKKGKKIIKRCGIRNNDLSCSYEYIKCTDVYYDIILAVRYRLEV